MKTKHLKILLSLLIIVLITLSCTCTQSLGIPSDLIYTLLTVTVTLWSMLFILDIRDTEKDQRELEAVEELLRFYLLHYKKSALALFNIDLSGEIVETFKIPRFNSMVKLYEPSVQNGKVVRFEDFFVAQQGLLKELKTMLYSQAFRGNVALQKRIIQYITRIEDLRLDLLLIKMRKEYQTLSQPILEAIQKEAENPKSLYKENNLLYTPAKLYFSIVCFKDFYDKILLEYSSGNNNISS